MEKFFGIGAHIVRKARVVGLMCSGLAELGHIVLMKRSRVEIKLQELMDRVYRHMHDSDNLMYAKFSQEMQHYHSNEVAGIPQESYNASFKKAEVILSGHSFVRLHRQGLVGG